MLAVRFRVRGRETKERYVRSVTEARDAFVAHRDGGRGYGYSTLNGAMIYADGAPVAWLSYNGRLWSGDNWPDAVELNDDLTRK